MASVSALSRQTLCRVTASNILSRLRSSPTVAALFCRTNRHYCTGLGAWQLPQGPRADTHFLPQQLGADIVSALITTDKSSFGAPYSFLRCR